MCSAWRLSPWLSKHLCAGQRFSANGKDVKGLCNINSNNSRWMSRGNAVKRTSTLAEVSAGAEMLDFIEG